MRVSEELMELGECPSGTFVTFHQGKSYYLGEVIGLLPKNSRMLVKVNGFGLTALPIDFSVTALLESVDRNPLPPIRFELGGMPSINWDYQS